MAGYKKKIVQRDGDQKIRKDSKIFDTVTYRRGDRVKLKDGSEGTILFMYPIAGMFLIEFEDLPFGATDKDITGYAD